MGAMAPPPHWIPEDDVLLKNAVEAGASLESLAKGAVQFSRRFTVQELQDHWFSLLYDPVVSVEASAHMIEVDRSGFSNQSRPNKFEGGKETAFSSGKRKAKSIRKCYYAMRKRICNEPFGMLGILSGPGYSNFGDGNELSSADCRIGNPVLNNLENEGPDFDVRHQCFPEFGPHPAEPTSRVVAPSFSVVQSHGKDLHLCGEHLSDNFPYPYEENMSLTGGCSEVPGFYQSKELPLCNLFEAESLVNEGSACSEFGGLQYHSFGCLSPLPQIPIWHTSQEISAAGLPIQIGEKDQQTRDAFMIPLVANENKSEALIYGGGSSNSILETPLSCDSMIDITSSTEDYLAELSSTLFNLENTDEPLFLDNDGKAIEKSYIDGLSSLLLDSPNQCELPCTGIGEAIVVADGRLVDTSAAHDGVSANKGIDLCDQHKVPDAQVAPSASTMKVFGPEYHNGVICCTLNTEDPEIPSNDDVFLPFRCPSPTYSSGSHWRLHDPSYLVSSSVKDFSSNRKTNGPLMMKNNQKGSCVPSRKIVSSQPSDLGLQYPKGNHGVKFELPKSNIQHTALRNARNSECPKNVSSENVNANNFISGVVGDGVMDMEQGKNIDHKSLAPCPNKHDSGLAILQSLQKNASGSRSGLDAKAEIPNNGSSEADLSFLETALPKPIDQSQLSDQEELWSENEFDVPYFSDIEAMILDMDLSPDEFDLYSNPEVQRYQHEETKRTIMRLEQAADAFTQRTIAGQGAFAVLYGRCSKHFIKEPEVLLGRATDDIKVDIDLGREKNGGKISRRQAIMRMDMYGVFHLKNLGKSSIHVNGKEVARGKSINLTSGCLIEVRGLTFVFEMNRKNIKQYVDSTAGGGLLLDHKPAN